MASKQVVKDMEDEYGIERVVDKEEEKKEEPAAAVTLTK